MHFWVKKVVAMERNRQRRDLIEVCTVMRGLLCRQTAKFPLAGRTIIRERVGKEGGEGLMGRRNTHSFCVYLHSIVTDSSEHFCLFLWSSGDSRPHDEVDFNFLPSGSHFLLSLGGLSNTSHSKCHVAPQLVRGIQSLQQHNSLWFHTGSVS